MKVPSPIARLLEGEDGGQLQPHNSIAMSSRLADYRNSLNDSYFKTRQKAAAKGAGDSLELVQLRKKSAAISRDFGTLLSAHERQEANVTDLRQKVRVLRQELETRDKALDLARRTLDRMNTEKRQLEAGAAGTQAYVRKLESRLLSVKHAAELQQRCMQLKSQLDEMAHALHEAEARAGAAEAAARQSQMDAACLKRGLELAAEQLTKSAGAEVPGTLLRAVARGQEEALALSMQLSDAKQQQAQLAAALEQARKHLQAQQQALMQQQAERQEFVQRAEVADATLEKQRAAIAELQRVLDAFKPKAAAFAEERDSLRQQLELERTAAAEAQKEAKQLREALRQKATIEVALRDELRRVLAGVGLTPSPSAAKSARSPVGAGRRGAGTAAPPRNASWLRQQQRRQQHQAAAGSIPAAQPSKPVGAPLSPRAQSAHKVLVRQASGWEQQEPAGQTSPVSGSLARKGALEQHGAGGSSGVHTSGSSGLTPAEPSPTRALVRLQEQRGQQQGSRLGVQQLQHECHERPVGRPGWQDAGAGWQLDHAEQPTQPGGSSTGRLEFENLGELLSPPSTGSRPTGSQKSGAVLKAGHSLQQQQQHKAQQLQLPPVLPTQSEQLMQIYATALDEQIAALQTDLAQLELTGRPSPISQLQAKAKAGAADPMGKQDLAAAQMPLPAGAPPRQVYVVAQQHDRGKTQPDIGAWQPNGAFDVTVLPAAHEMQQLRSPGGDTPAHAGSSKPTVPLLWHSNPLAASPPKRQCEEAGQEEDEEPLPEQLADGALTIRARSAPAGHEQPTGEMPPAGGGSEEDWVWGQLQQVHRATEESVRSAASSPSLCLPGAESSAVLQLRHEEGHVVETAAMAAVVPSDFELQPPKPTASQGSCGACDSGMHSLSRHWDLPSPSAGHTDWLSGEADIEQLEVNSTTHPYNQLQRPQQEHAEAAWEAVAVALAAEHGVSQQQRQLSDWLPATSGDWASQWDGSSGSGQGDGQQVPPLIRHEYQQQRPRPILPLLPGLALVSNSPQLQVPVPDGESRAPAAVQQQEPQQLRTLFDLAGMDMSELLSN